MSTGLELIPAAGLAGRLFGVRGRARRRKEIAERCHGVLVFERRSSNEALWECIGQELPGWNFSRVIPPLTMHRLEECLGELDPTKAAAATHTEAVRSDMRAVVNDLYHLLVAPDYVTRGCRRLRHIYVVRRQIGFSRWERVFFGVVIVLIAVLEVVTL